MRERRGSWATLAWRVIGAACAALLVVAIGAVLVDIAVRGHGRLGVGYLTSASSDLGRAGGVGPVLLATAWLLVVALVVAVPLGVGCGLHLAGAGGARRPPAWVHTAVDVLAATPSIVIGLFGAALFVDGFGLGPSLLAGGLTLGLMIVPYIVRATELALAGLGPELERDARALALSRATTLAAVILPAARRAIGAGVIIATARAAAETAALVFTAGYDDRWPDGVGDPGRALSVHILDLAMNVPGGDDAAYAAALVLVLIVTAAEVAGAGWLVAQRRRAA